MFRVPVSIAIVLPAAAFAQVPESASQVPIPVAPVIVLPAPSPTPTPSPTPAAVPTAAAVPVPAAAATPRAAPAPEVPATPSPTPTPTPTPTSQPDTSPTPAVLPAPAARPTVVAPPSPAPAATAAPVPATAEPFNWTPWLLGGAGLALLVLLWVRYQRDAPVGPGAGAYPEESAAAPPAVHRPSGQGPWLTATLRPVRAGLNMVTAVADCEITVVNEGSAPAEAIRTALVLVAAQGNALGEIDPADLEPIVRPIVPPFTLAPGEARTFRGVAAAQLDTLPTMQAGGREMLVPMVVLTLQHRDPGGAEHRMSQGFVVGVERVDSPKLAPFWLDSLRMIDQVAARPSGAPQRQRVSGGGGGVGYIS